MLYNQNKSLKIPFFFLFICSTLFHNIPIIPNNPNNPNNLNLLLYK
jgi:hypothetical protein